MEVGGNSYNFDENQQGNDKEKSNLENPSLCGPYSNRKNFNDESSNFERNKKLCTWHPPIKNESGSVSNEFSERLNFCVNTQTEVNSSESTIPANVISVLPEISAIHSQLSPEHLHENDKCEHLNFLSCSTIQNINDAFDSYQDCDEEIKSVSSLDTLPTEIVVDECDDSIHNLNNEKAIPFANKNKDKIGFLNYDNGYLNNEIEKETVTYENEEHIRQMTENKVKFSNLERMENLGTNLVLTEEVAMTVLNAKGTENKQLQSLCNEKYAKEKMGSFYDTNYYSEDKISDGNKFRNIDDSGPLQNSCIQGGNYSNTINGNVINQQNITRTKKTTIRSETCNDDTFDLTFTSSQLEKLECDETTAVYNSYTNKSNNFWIRKKKEQKEILQKVIKDIDTLNNSIVQATNELRTQFCKNFPK